MKKILTLIFCISMLIFTSCSNSISLKSEDSAEKPAVYMTSNLLSEGLVKVYEALQWSPNGKVALKISTGEPPASNYLRPELMADLVNKVGATIVECNTAYGGERSDTAEHMKVAEEHGFTKIAPVDIQDAEGSTELTVKMGSGSRRNS